MDVIKLLVVFSIIVVTLWFKKPLVLALILAIIATPFLYQLSVETTFKSLLKAATSWGTWGLVLLLYIVTFLQKMMESRKCMHNAQEAMNALFNNNRINASITPAILGLLPAAATIKMCGVIVRQSTDGYLTKEQQAGVTAFFRHVPELFLPTYASILIGIQLTHGAVEVGPFVLAMIPMAALLFVIGNVIYLRKVPRDAVSNRDKTNLQYILMLLLNLWPLLLTIVMIIAFHITVYVAVAINILLFAIIGKFRPKELLPFFKSSFEVKMLTTAFFVMLFNGLLNTTGAVMQLPSFFSKFPIPTFLVFALIFFLGSIVSSAQAIVVLFMEAAMSTVATGHTGLALFVMLMSMAYAAMQVSPTHVCYEICADDFKVSLGSVFSKTLPLALIFCAGSIMYYFILSAFGF